MDILIPATGSYAAMAWCYYCGRIVECDPQGRLYNHYIRGETRTVICRGTSLKWKEPADDHP